MTDDHRTTPERLLHPGLIDTEQGTLKTDANHDEIGTASIAPHGGDLS